MLVTLSLVWTLGLSCEQPRSFECAAPEQVTRVAGVHYEGLACEAAIASAEGRLTAAYYRKACEQLAPRSGLPGSVDDAYVTACRPAGEQAGGSLLDIDLCCPRLR